jgi:uncharacterized protein YdaU (DUF1376 family)
MSRRVASLTPLARGVYAELLFRQWYEGGLPGTDEELAICARCSPEEWSEVKKSVLQFFTKSRDGKLRETNCEREKRTAKNNLNAFRKKTENARKERLRKRQQDNELFCPQNEDSSVTEEPDRTGPYQTGPDRTLPDPSPLPPPHPPAVVRSGNGEEKHPPPRGTTTVFDQQAEITELLDRYTAGDDPFTPDPEDEANARKAIDQITAGSRPGAKLLFLRTLAQFEPLQVCMAAHDWLNLPDLPTGDPKGYFIGMVRGSGKRKYVRYADRVEVKRERTQQDARKREARGKDKPVDQPPPDASPVPGVHRVGDVLRNLPAVRRARTTTRQTPPEKADDVPDSG